MTSLFKLSDQWWLYMAPYLQPDHGQFGTGNHLFWNIPRAVSQTCGALPEGDNELEDGSNERRPVRRQMLKVPPSGPKDWSCQAMQINLNQTPLCGFLSRMRQQLRKRSYGKLGGGFKYFSNGLKPPTRKGQIFVIQRQWILGDTVGELIWMVDWNVWTSGCQYVVLCANFRRKMCSN